MSAKGSVEQFLEKDLGDVDYSVNRAVGSFQLIPLSCIQESPRNPRKDYGDLEELARAIQGAGKVIQPLLLRPVADGMYEICAGHRRFRAARIAGLTEVPAVVREMDDAEFISDLNFENLGRKDLHPLEEASGFQTLMKDLGWTVEAIAEKLGKEGGSARSTSHVYARLKLLNLIPRAQEAFLRGEFEQEHAVLISRRSPKDQEKCLTKMQPPAYNPHHKVSVRELKDFIRTSLEIVLAEAPFPVADVALVLEAGSCETCQKRSGNDPTQADPEEKDLCQEPACFQRKVEAHLDRQRQALRAKGELVELSTAWSTKRKDVLPHKRWQTADERAKGPDIKTGLVVEGRRDEVGQVLRVKVKAATPESCDDGRGSTAAATPATKRESKEEVEARKKQEEAKVAAEKAARTRVLDAILREVKWPLGRAVVQKLLAVLTADTECGELFDERHGGVFGYNTEVNEKALAKMPELALAKVAVEALAGADVDDARYGREPETLTALARAYGVDYKRAREAEAPKAAGKPAVKKAAAKKAPVKKSGKKK